MDSQISTAARALAVGDPLGALKYVALRSDPPALALRGIAMAQLGDFAAARKLLQKAATAFGSDEAVAQARCVTAEAEVALAAQDWSGSGRERKLELAAGVLAKGGDQSNALLARLIGIRRSVLLGQVEQARLGLNALDLTQAPPRLRAVAELVTADVAMRLLESGQARAALGRAEHAARSAGIPALLREVSGSLQKLAAPVARLLESGGERAVRLDEVEALLASGAFVVDACRREVRANGQTVSLLTRPVLLSIALTLAEAAPNEAPRAQLIARAFGVARVNESHRARLRVEVGRLRKAIAALAELPATRTGFVLVPRRHRQLSVLLPPEPGEASALVALLGSGAAWSTSALSTALGKSPRSVQRALRTLAEAGKVRSSGRGRAQRWVAPPSTAFATTLLLVARGSLG